MVKRVEELPERTMGAIGLDWTAITEEVEAGGGDWFEIGVFSPSVATHIRRGRYRRVDPEKFEVTTERTNEPRRSTLYMRLRVPE